MQEPFGAGYFKILQDLVELKNHWLWLFQSSQRTGGFYETTGPKK